MKWIKTGYNTWQLGHGKVYKANLPHDVFFATINGKRRKFLSNKEAADFITVELKKPA